MPSQERKIPIAIARGDGIGPEILAAVLHILEEAGAPLEYREIEVGEKIYSRGVPTGIEPQAWETLKRAKAFLKAPITTPQGGGFKSLNVTIRTMLGLYANVRPCVAYAPFIETKHPGMNVTIIRENEEDLYTGIEYRQSFDASKSIKLISRPGSEKIVRYAFEYARRRGRKKVTCFTKDNIMKLSDGLFHKVYEEIAEEYPEIEKEHWIVDIGAAKLADKPELFDVVVLPNLYGDILSDVAAQISGSVGLVGSANVGDHGAMFEAIHGSAPRRAGQNLANPSGLLHASLLMLIYLGEAEVAERIHNAWLCTIEAGVHTYDVFVEGKSKLKVGTKEFAEHVVKHLGEKPRTLPPATSKTQEKWHALPPLHRAPKEKRTCVGIDITLFSQETQESIVQQLTKEHFSPLKLHMISNRGARIWPEGQPETFCVDQWRLRFMHEDKKSTTTPKECLEALHDISRLGYEIVNCEMLYTFDGAPAFSSPEG